MNEVRRYDRPRRARTVLAALLLTAAAALEPAPCPALAQGLTLPPGAFAGRPLVDHVGVKNVSDPVKGKLDALSDALKRRLDEFQKYERALDCATRSSLAECGVPELVTTGVCAMLASKGPANFWKFPALIGDTFRQAFPNAIPPDVGAGLDVIGNLMAAAQPTNWCDGGFNLFSGNLKCSQFPGEFGCHSSFNTAKPIQCEGNPIPGCRSFGVCVTTGFPGCICTIYPACAPGGVTDLEGTTDDVARVDGYLVNLRNRIYDDLRAGGSQGGATGDGIWGDMNFGCARGSIFLSQTVEPFLDEADWPAMPGETSDAATRLRLHAATMAVRIGLGAPNGILRFLETARRVWTAPERAAALAAAGVIDVDATLLQSLSPYGLELVKTILGDDYVLLAVPAPGEPVLARDPAAVYRDSLRCGDDCSLSATAKASKSTKPERFGTVTLSFKAEDPEPNSIGYDAVTIDWGDGRVDTHMAVRRGRRGKARHVYAEPGTFQIEVTVTNGASRTCTTTVSVEAPTGSCQAVEPSVERVELAGFVNSYLPLTYDVVGVDDRGREFSLGGTLLPSPFVFSPIALPDRVLHNPAIGALHAIRVSVSRTGTGGSAELLLSSITLHEHQGAGLPTALREISILPEMVISPDGGTVPPPYDATRQAVRLIVPGAGTRTYEIALPDVRDGDPACGP